MADMHPISCDQDTLDTLAVSVTQDPPNRALELLDQALERYPRDARILLLRGSIYASIRDTVPARADFTRAMILSPALEEARLMLGQLEYDEGMVDEARAVWSSFLSDTNPRTAVTLVGQAMVCLLDGLAEPAENHLRDALLASPSEAIRTYIEQLLGRLDTRDAGGAGDGPSHYLLSDYLSSQSRH